MDNITQELLKQIADLDSLPKGAYNFRVNGKGVARNSTPEIEIETKSDKPGINIYIKPNTIGQSVHIPVMLSEEGLSDMVYNDFYVGENSDVVIVAGCGIHNCSDKASEHDGIHTFHIGKNAKVKYIEKHLGIGEENSDRILNPTTKVYIKNGGTMQMETTQIGGVTFADRRTSAYLDDNAKLIIQEKILTTDDQYAKTKFIVYLNGQKSSVDVVSRAVAKDYSEQIFNSTVVGRNECFGHVECDGILSDNALITSTPKIIAESVEASLVHEAAIGKISEEQATKLMTLGLTKEQAEQKIIEGFLK